MTIRNLINELEQLVEDCGDDTMEVVVAEYQTYGSFAYSVSDIDVGTYTDWDNMNPNNKNEDDDEPNCIKIILGRQIGTMHDDY
ncbi:MAG TPA: hypothetical protein DCL29_05845 [Eubacterium sp.]|nr:hypothetical protein [Eubacterium sp.]